MLIYLFNSNQFCDKIPSGQSSRSILVPFKQPISPIVLCMAVILYFGTMWYLVSNLHGPFRDNAVDKMYLP